MCYIWSSGDFCWARWEKGEENCRLIVTGHAWLRSSSAYTAEWGINKHWNKYSLATVAWQIQRQLQWCELRTTVEPLLPDPPYSGHEVCILVPFRVPNIEWTTSLSRTKIVGPKVEGLTDGDLHHAGRSHTDWWISEYSSAAIINAVTLHCSSLKAVNSI